MFLLQVALSLKILLYFSGYLPHLQPLFLPFIYICCNSTLLSTLPHLLFFLMCGVSHLFWGLRSPPPSKLQITVVIGKGNSRVSYRNSSVVWTI